MERIFDLIPNSDEERKKNPDLKVPGDPDYSGPIGQYNTVYGSANQLVVELDVEKPTEKSYAEMTHNEEFLPRIVPGQTVVPLLKQFK